MKAPSASAAFLLLLLPWLSAMPSTRAGRDWPVYHADPAGTHYSTLDQIHRGNVHRLQPAWIHRCEDARPGTTIQCNPLVIDGIMYGTTPGLRLFALDASSGRERWTFDPWGGRPGRGVSRGLATWSDGSHRRLFFSTGNLLHAIDADSGRPIPEFGNEGSIDLREDLDHEARHLAVHLTTPGVVYRDLLIIGSAIPDTTPPTAPGHIRAYDVRTGKRRWIFHTIPRPGQPHHETWSGDSWHYNGGANAWGGLTLDPERGLVFAGTGSPNYDHYGGDRIGMNLFANCVLALEAATGRLRWHFQTVHHDLWDYDLPCPPVLLEVRRDGRTVAAAAQVTKTGHVFLLDRETGEPLFPVEERPVPRSDVPGEMSWPTQPFPLKPPPFARQGFTTDDITDLNPAAAAAVRERLRDMRFGPLFTPPSTNATVVMPQFNGGAEWGGAAVDPASGRLFINASNEPEWIQMLPAKPRAHATLREIGAHLHGALCSSCHGSARTDLPPQGTQPLTGVPQRLTPEAVDELLRNGRGQMPAFASLTSLERQAVVAFLFGTEDGYTPIRLDDDGTEGSLGQRLPYVANGHPTLRDPEGFPASRRPWGTLTAIDLNRGEIDWQIPLGTYPELEKRGLPPTGTFNIGGPIVTAGGLLFIGATMDERFRAFDTADGRLLWEYQLDAGAYATPATFEVNGRQHVLVAAGGGGKPETRHGTGWWCFALPEEAPVPGSPDAGGGTAFSPPVNAPPDASPSP